MKSSERSTSDESAYARDSPRAVRDEDAAGPMGDLARHRPVALADLVQQRRPARVGQQLPAVADQAAGRHDELEPGAPIGIGAHLLQASLAGGHRLLHDADVVGRDVDRDPLVRLLAVALDHLGA